MRHVTIAALAVLLLASPAQGQGEIDWLEGLKERAKESFKELLEERARQLPQEPQVLYCVDEGATGFKWDDKGNVQSTSFIERHFTVKVVSETEVMIAWSGGRAAEELTCTRYLNLNCGPAHRPIIFGPKGYTRALLWGRPQLNGMMGVGFDIMVAYGTCTKF